MSRETQRKGATKIRDSREVVEGSEQGCGGGRGRGREERLGEEGKGKE